MEINFASNQHIVKGMLVWSLRECVKLEESPTEFGGLEDEMEPAKKFGAKRPVCRQLWE